MGSQERPHCVASFSQGASQSFHCSKPVVPLQQASCSRGIPETTSLKPAQGPSKIWLIIADWGHAVAMLCLIVAFLEGALIFSAQMGTFLEPGGAPTKAAILWLQFLFSSVGTIAAISSFIMVGVMAKTPPEQGGGATACLQFAMLMTGGILFALSTPGNPGCITNITYAFSTAPCAVAGGTPYEWNALGHYGIICFMVPTAIGLKGVMEAPKNKFISHFWGTTMFFLGAWTIGIFKYWGPVLAGGFNSKQNEVAFDFAAPSITWVWTWWFGLIGAIFLELGALIFGLMNGSFGVRIVGDHVPHGGIDV